MKTIKRCVLVGGLAVTMLTVAGCALFVAGAGAAAGAGAVGYFGNEIRAIREVSVDRAWNAANAAMTDMGFMVIAAETHKDTLGGVVQGRNAKDQIVRIEVVRQSDKLTEIRVRVGAFALEDNRKAEQLLFDAISRHF